MELVVHLRGGKEIRKRLRDEHDVLPKRVPGGRGQFEGFYDMALRDDRNVSGQRRARGRRSP